MRLSSYVGLTGLTALALVGCKSSTEPGTHQTHPNGILVDSLSLGGRPHGVTIAPNNTFCVSQIDANSITCGTLTATSVSFGPAIAVGATPAHVALDPEGQTAYTANQSANTSSIVNVASAQVTATVPLGHGGFNVTASRTNAYVTTATGDLVIIDASTRLPVKTLSVGSAANGLALDGSGGMLYVSSRDAGKISAVNTSTNMV